MGQTRTKIVIIGAGLGGLLTAAYLAKHGHDVCVLEALDVVGGRFTHVDYEGFAVPTGAFHALPGGKRGPLFQCLEEVGLELALVEPVPSFCIVFEGGRYPLDLRSDGSGGSGLRRALGITSKPRLLQRVAAAKVIGALGGDMSVATMVSGLSPSDRAVRVMDHMTGFAVGVPAAAASAVDLVRSLVRQRFGREAFLADGNRSLAEGLSRTARAAGAEVRTRTRVQQIALSAGKVTGVLTEDGEFIASTCVVSNAGAVRTAQLLGEHTPPALTAKIQRMIPAEGVAYAVRSRQALHDHSSVEIPADLQFIAGISPISAICPALSPPGWSYSLAYQVLSPGSDANEQVERGREELEGYLGAHAEVFNTAIYRGRHPAAAMAQQMGQHGRSRFAACVQGVRGLYMVGHDVAGYGMGAEVIGDACLRLWQRLK